MGLQDISYPSFTTLDMAKNYLRIIKKSLNDIRLLVFTVVLYFGNNIRHGH